MSSTTRSIFINSIRRINILNDYVQYTLLQNTRHLLRILLNWEMVGQRGRGHTKSVKYDTALLYRVYTFSHLQKRGFVLIVCEFNSIKIVNQQLMFCAKKIYSQYSMTNLVIIDMTKYSRMCYKGVDVSYCWKMPQKSALHRTIIFPVALYLILQPIPILQSCMTV